jgi:hypothetical protein
MIQKPNTIIIICTTCLSLNTIAQKQTMKPDLSNENGFYLVNRGITLLVDEQGKPVVHLSEKPNNGVAWLNDVNFKTGIVEFDVKGKNKMQQSFVGIAFHGLNDSTYDGVYFRPFNFQSPDTTRRNHSVQYISLPKYDWSALRERYPGKYENALVNTMDPENWFHAKIIIEADNITVYVNDDKKASLMIKPVNNRTTGKIGFWVGNNSDGDFKNLYIQKN